MKIRVKEIMKKKDDRRIEGHLKGCHVMLPIKQT